MGKLFKCYHKEFEFTLITFLIRFFWIFSYEFFYFSTSSKSNMELIKKT